MKSKVFSCLLCFLFLFLVSCKKNDAPAVESLSTSYTESISNLNSINAEKLLALLSEKKEIIVYVGKESCPYCRIFAPKLHDAVAKANSSVYYLDVDADDSPELATFIEKYNIEYTPSLLIFDRDGQYKNLDFDSEKVTVENLVTDISRQ
ncbi:hypothetical protein A5882_003775 [Enterococcus sp. 4E1_DIV0656]|uniref:thioredoxin family protein n=1 Tax=Enterococcus sp. 4E1_DIV0656 TaxID=1834180 RepID=UPI000A3ABED0|nr:thioredoxin family protein [Enterococcus sp. 4E1_DIV0656]OTO08303.1 hypothetical protein A5882_003775 [Enterococcus sp. 4E1_DIV0656]